MQSQQVLHPSWPYNEVDQSVDESFLYGLDMDTQMGEYVLSPSITVSQDSFDMSSINYFSNNELLDMPNCDSDIQLMLPIDHSLNLEEFGCTSNENQCSNEIDSATPWLEEQSSSPQYNYSSNEGESEASLISSVNMFKAVPSQLVQPELVFPQEDMETENQIIIPHLLKAYGDAIDNEQGELAEVIVQHIEKKVRPSGTAMERLAYYLFDKQGDYLKQESSKNYEAAFKAFYSIFPYGRFVHFTANLAILEAVPKDTKAVHIVDFQLGDGAQWPPLIEAMGKHIPVRLISLKCKESDSDSILPQWRFEDTKRHLCDHANSFGSKLEVCEMDMDEIISGISTMRGDEFVAFNSMLSLPHMGRSRSSRSVVDFVRIAKELISKTSKRGIVVFGNGDVTERSTENFSRFRSFFNEHLIHFNAMFESIDWLFPSHLTEAKIAMECLFVAPLVSSHACFQKWKESQEERMVESVLGRQSYTFSRENVLQAKEIVRGGEGLYDVRAVGSEMVLEWRGSPLVRVSAWT